MPNHGSIYQARNSNQNVDISISRGVITQFDEAYRKFWERRGVDVTVANTKILAEKWKLSDPVLVDSQRLKKAIEYGRSYRKDG